MPSIAQRVKKSAHIIASLLITLSFVVSFIVLFTLYPDSFEETWKGRTYYLFFLWLVSLEMILNWERLQTNQLNRTFSVRTAIFAISLALPVVYVLVANFLGLNERIVDFSLQRNMGSWFAKQMPVSTEYLVFGAMFLFMNLTTYGRRSLADFSIPTSLLFIVGIIYMLDNFFPRGQFTPFQIFVPTTAQFAANVLNYLGYQTEWLGATDGMPTLRAWDSQGRSSPPFSIAWPCSGVESLLIYTITILLFLKKSSIPWKQRVIYFIAGALVTYFINILRIVTIFVISINRGDVQAFHSLYGQLYSITWIISYPLIIIASRILWRRIKCWRTFGQDPMIGVQEMEDQSCV